MNHLSRKSPTRPIIFSAPMIRAILSGAKSQTRRVVKPQPKTEGLAGVYADLYNHEPGNWAFWLPDKRMTEPRTWHCPHGVPGETKLWVREAWAKDGESGVLYRADAIRDDSGERDGWWFGDRFHDGDIYWRPSIFMPREFSRLTLELTAVRVERLQDISEADAMAEAPPRCESKMHNHSITAWASFHDFANLWDSLNARRGYPWSSNCWVWKLVFKKHESQPPQTESNSR